MLKHVSAIIKPKTKKLIGDKRHRLLTCHWQEFVGERYSSRCELHKITFTKLTGERCLTILADNGSATELDYLHQEIIQRINTFLGEDYITKIRIKQGFDSTQYKDTVKDSATDIEKPPASTEDNFDIAKTDWQVTDDNPLRDRLNRLAESLNRHQ